MEQDNIKEKEVFKIANDINFYDACFDFEDGIDKNFRTNRPLQLVGDRIRLINCLKKHGFSIIKTNTN